MERVTLRLRSLTVALLLAALPAAAQPPQAQAPDRSPTPVPLPSIGLPLPPIGLPLPRIGLPPVSEPQRARTPPPGAEPPGDGTRRPRHPHQTIVYFGAPYGWVPAGWTGTAALSSPVEGTMTPGVMTPEPAEPPVSYEYGWLRLEVEPLESVQVFVDGNYVGMPADFDRVLALNPGLRRIELRAPRHAASTFDARITAGRTISYRGELAPLAAAPPEISAPSNADALAAEARPKQTFYFIPGCYMGNVPPHEVKLPADCDLSRLTTWTP